MKERRIIGLTIILVAFTVVGLIWLRIKDREETARNTRILWENYSNTLNGIRAEITNADLALKQLGQTNQP